LRLNLNKIATPNIPACHDRRHIAAVGNASTWRMG
jgi:hypothetical protein